MVPFKAMILAAGLGTRLRPLSLCRPKVLVPVQNQPLLHWLVQYLRRSGAEAIVVNAHHLGELLIAEVNRQEFGIPVAVSFEDTLLGTGGGIRNVLDFWDERPFVVLNGDILSSIDLQQALRQHRRSGAAATLVLVEGGNSDRIQVAEDGRIISFRKESAVPLTFSGIQVLERDTVAGIPAGKPASIIDYYQQLIGAGRKLVAWRVRGAYWRELGTVEKYLSLHQEFFTMERSPLPGVQARGTRVLHPSVRLGAGVRLEGMVCLGARCEVGDGVTIANSIIWDGVRLEARSSVRNSIIADRVVVSESVSDGVIVA